MLISGISLKSIFDTNGPHKQHIQVGNIFNYVLWSGLQKHVFTHVLQTHLSGAGSFLFKSSNVYANISHASNPSILIYHITNPGLSVCFEGWGDIFTPYYYIFIICIPYRPQQGLPIGSCRVLDMCANVSCNALCMIAFMPGDVHLAGFCSYPLAA